MTIDPTHAAEPGRDAIRTWTPDTANPDTDVLPIYAASAAAAGFAPPGGAGDRAGDDATWSSTGDLATGSTPDDYDGAPGPGASGRQRRPWGSQRPHRRTLVAVAGLLVLSLGLAGYLWATTRAYSERAAWTEDQARAIGTELATTRTELEGTTAELEAVRAQLDTAQTRITALADEKAQVGDDREAQRQLVDYQQRVSEAAGTVASALERCVQGQDTLIGYLNNPTAYDPAQLAAYGTEVDGLCQSATDANKSLQDELSR